MIGKKGKISLGSESNNKTQPVPMKMPSKDGGCKGRGVRKKISRTIGKREKGGGEVTNLDDRKE